MPPETTPSRTPAESADRLRALAAQWAAVDANERASFQTWFLQFCDALGAPAPLTPTEEYRFELPVKVVDREGQLGTNFIDAWHAGHFAMEAKMSEPGRGNDTLLRKAFGQVRNYALQVEGTPPPFLMVVDVPRTLILWDRWSGSYGDFGAGRRIALNSLHERPDDIALLQDVFTRPAARDPRGRAQAVTRDIAAQLAQLASSLEGRGLEQERVARFLMRCVFSCFAEDVGLLPDQLFRKTLEAARGSGDPTRLKAALELLWKTMDEGGMFGAEMLHRFNGHFFKTREALPLEANDVALLIEAAAHDWARVEPSIFGTLLVRALDPAERHRLGAEYTPREYIERLVEPTVVEPIRERWTAVQAAVVQLEETGKKKDRAAATKTLLEFHTWTRGLRFLDPACGSGNFLYVTMAAVKRIEHEVLNELQRLSDGQGGLVLDEVHPRQFFGIEIKPWAREIAELTLWIGYHQFWRETHGGRTPPDPILEDTGTIECRDAVLAYDEIVHRPEKDRPDPTPRITSPVTGELVPDPGARLPYYEYVNARKAEWPTADFIVGNPPYLGQARQRDAFGDGYVEALRSVYKHVPDSADLVMYWWHRGSEEVAAGRTMRVGFITTNSIRQGQNRAVVAQAQERGAHVVWAVADHPWVDEADGAAVRVSLTVTARQAQHARLLTVDDEARVTSERSLSHSLNVDLTAGADVSTAAKTSLRANEGLSSPGFKLHGAGFILARDEAHELLADDKRNAEIVHPYVNGKDVTDRPRGVYLIDFGMREEDEARGFARLFDIVRNRVKPERTANKRATYSKYWWRFGEPRAQLRPALEGLAHSIVTPETAKHRFFVRLAGSTAPDNKLIVIASEDATLLGILSSQIHVTWGLATGARLEDRPVYVKSLCFDAFPFPDPSPALRQQIADLAEKLDAHRKAAIARDERVTMTGMYNVVEKLRTGTALTPNERAVHEIAACGVLRDLHDEIDALVAKAYGWPWPMEREEILERLVALHDERVGEEKNGRVRWLRPEYQVPRFAPEQAATLALETPAKGDQKKATKSAKAPKLSTSAGGTAAAVPVAHTTWPATALEQIAGITALLASKALTEAQVIGAFIGVKKEMVARHLETLELMGEITRDNEGRYRGATYAA